MANVTYLPTPYSYASAVQAGAYVFLGLHRGFGDTFAEQLQGALDGVEDTLGRLGFALADVVKLQVWLKHIDDLPTMEQTIGTRFAADRCPARMTATTEFIDADCLVMLEGVAYKE